MVNRITIGGKITFLVVSIVLASVLLVGFVASDLGKRTVAEKTQENLAMVAGQKARQIEAFFEQVQTGLLLARQLPDLRDNLAALVGTPAEANLQVAAQTKVDAVLAPLGQASRLHNLYLTDANGKILSRAASNAQSQPVGATLSAEGLQLLGEFRQANQSLVFGPVAAHNGGKTVLAATMIQSPDGPTTGFLVGVVDLSPVFAALDESTGLGASGEALLLTRQKDAALCLNKPRHVAAANQLTGFTTRLVGLLQNGPKGVGQVNDYRGNATFAAWQPVANLQGSLVVKMDVAEALSSITRFRSRFVMVGLLTLAVSLVVGLIFSRLLTGPMLALKENMKLLGQGVLPEKLEKRSADEVGEMTDTVNQLVEGLKKTADFAHKIGAGNFDATFKPISENDNLGVALLNMRDSIQAAAKRDDEQNWIVTGVAEIGDILRSTNNLDELGDRVVAYLTNKIGAIQGAFYVVNDEEGSQPVIEMTASYAYHKKKYLQARFRFAEGLVGQAAIEQDTLLRTEIPNNYVTITSGLLGDRRPKCILVVPLITVVGSQKKVFGVMEYAGFEKFSSRNVRFIKEVSEIIARTVFNIKVNETTRKLLEQSQRQSEELQIQQEVLRQNAEEMQATQEELKRTNQALEQQIEQVNHAQKRMQVLLENASEIITIYDLNRMIRFVSPSLQRILGYSPEEMIGMNDVVYVHELGVESVDRMFSELMQHPDQSVTIQFSYLCKNGDRVWLEATGTNRLSDPAINGIVVNSRDITERRKADKEARMRGQMQALSENSPDLITRFNKEGRVFYINPIIESYSGHQKEAFFQKQLDELTLEPGVVENWKNILQTVLTSQEKVSAEMDFPSSVGNRVMQVNAIPEFNDQSVVESVLFVSHDITERKMAELEIQSKNRKITESINYAKRIQGAILPNNDIIKQVFPDAFILYKPRDVVSGDFPWFMQKGDDLYIAAVDCTGHGVPGALISLIGYFLLNNIVGSPEDLAPGEILDRLDYGVTHTLRQDNSDSSTRDGMDIALCKINLKKNTLHYAGAHRPLYYTQNGELLEIKGDKFPIGGGQYKGRTNFTTIEIAIQPGDGAYFCSDGFPDQFGGPENRKFSPKRIRDIITGNPGMNMSQIHQVFDQEFEAWKGDTKQTDDVLMIGIKF
jgi:PAS domain S-box-containing protein